MSILRMISVDVVGPSDLRLVFNNGDERTVSITPLLVGPVFEPLQNPAYFALGRLDPICGTVVWPNGADFAPEALYTASTAAVTT